MEMDGRMKGSNQNQQASPVPWKGGGLGVMAMPENLGGGASDQREGMDNIQGQGHPQQLLHYAYPATHLNPNFYHQYHHHQPQQQQQQQPQFKMRSPTFGGGEGGWPSMYYSAPAVGHHHPHGFNGYYVQAPAQHYAVGGPPPLYANPFGMNGNPSVSAATPYAQALPQYMHLPSYPNPFQTHPLQFQELPASSNFPDSGQVHPGEAPVMFPSASTHTPSPRIWRPISSPPIGIGHHTPPSYGAQTSPALPQSTDAMSYQGKLERERRSSPDARAPEQELGKYPRVKAKVLVGKRRGGSKILPTGVIKRTKESHNVAGTGTQGNAGPGTKSRYMAEVEHYQRQTCSDDKPVRPLVK